MLSILGQRLDGNVSDGTLGFVEVGVASGESADGEEVIGDAVQAPAGESDVGGGECDRELLRRRIVAFLVIGPEVVVEELAGGKAVPVPITRGELDAGAVLVGDLDAGVFLKSLMMVLGGSRVGGD